LIHIALKINSKEGHPADEAVVSSDEGFHRRLVCGHDNLSSYASHPQPISLEPLMPLLAQPLNEILAVPVLEDYIFLVLRLVEYNESPADVSVQIQLRALHHDLVGHVDVFLLELYQLTDHTTGLGLLTHILSE
jgi:hypothetical protein